MSDILCDCCNARLEYDNCFAVPRTELDSPHGDKRLEEWIHVMPGRVSRIVCEEDYRDYIEIVTKKKFDEVPAALRERAYAAAKQRAQAYLDGDTTGSRVGPFVGSSQASGCFIATACYGSVDCPSVMLLREFRDNCLSRAWLGRAFIALYYTISPPIARWLECHSVARLVVKRLFVAPMVGLASRLRSPGR